MEKKQIELYDMGRTTHKAVPGMYEFIVNHADRFVSDSRLAEELRQQAANREQPGYSIPQGHFSEMCRIWADAFNRGEFPINVPKLVFPDTPKRFMAVKRAGRKIGVFTSGSAEFTKILFNCSFRSEDSVTRKYADTQLGREIFHYDEDRGWTVDKKHPHFSQIDSEANFHLGYNIDEFLLGEEIGDKDHPETFARLWETRKGDIHSVYDDKISVCEAAIDGLKQAGGSARIYLVDRKGKYNKGELADKVCALQSQGVRLIKSFDEVKD